MKIIYFEGTPEEFAPIAHLLHANGNQPTANGNQPTEEPTAVTDDGGTPSLTQVEAMQVLFRNFPVTLAQRAIYDALAHEDDLISYRELSRRTDLDSSRLGGAQSGLKRRIKRTPEIERAGIRPNNAVFRWQERADGWWVGLTDHAREALKAEGII